ncbi:hypothetical protein K2173_012601 [Erythroxylum novogranatense]|uniref:Ternary complex factor MIP1 leucine-zipper domain-containing protein n=1 Tax=Erythroxylum novogranatense TaxID=1862640 RepID=A0AAV8T269_9ROSI|nr:hypothetical protein K2173_012601 [Erythroxylum novogranatense]
MKFEDYLMQPGDDKQTRLDLEKEVEELEAELDKEKAIKKALYSALHGPIPTNPCLPSFFPPQAKGLLAEIRMVGDEIAWLEKKVDELKLNLYEQKKQNKEWTVKKQQRGKLRQHNNLPPFSPGKLIMSEDCCELSRTQNFQEYKEEKVHLRRVSVGSAGEMFSFFYPCQEFILPQRKHKLDKVTYNVLIFITQKKIQGGIQGEHKNSKIFTGNFAARYQMNSQKNYSDA